MPTAAGGRRRGAVRAAWTGRRRPERAPAAVRGGAEAAGAQRAAGVGRRRPGSERAAWAGRTTATGGAQPMGRRAAGRLGAGSLRRRWRELTALEGVRDGGEEGARGEEGGRQCRGRGRLVGEEETGQVQA